MSFSVVGRGGSSGPVGRVRPTSLNADAAGWFICDGRAAALLPAVAQASMVVLALANLPVMTNLAERELGALNTTAGSDANVALTPANMPPIVVNGTFNQVDNPHTHTLGGGVNIRRSNGGLGIGTASGGTSMGPVVNSPNTTQGGAHAHAFNSDFGGVAQAIAQEDGYIATRFHIFLGV